MRGKPITVKTFEATGKDPFGSDVFADVESVVDNVLYSPGASSDVTESNRPSGAKVAYTLHFPKTFSGSLAGAKLLIEGEWYDVIGDPKPYMIENTPGDWWMTVEAGVVNG